MTCKAVVLNECRNEAERKGRRKKINEEVHNERIRGDGGQKRKEELQEEKAGVMRQTSVKKDKVLTPEERCSHPLIRGLQRQSGQRERHRHCREKSKDRRWC